MKTENYLRLLLQLKNMMNETEIEHAFMTGA